MKDVSLADIATRLEALEARIDQRFAGIDQRFAGIDQRFNGIERLQYWTLGLVGGLVLSLLTGSFAIIATLL